MTLARDPDFSSGVFASKEITALASWEYCSALRVYEPRGPRFEEGSSHTFELAIENYLHFESSVSAAAAAAGLELVHDSIDNEVYWFGRANVVRLRINVHQPGESSDLARDQLQDLDSKALAAGKSGHALSRHGADTTVEEQYIRAVTGLTPDGVQHTQRVSSSRFLSNELQLNAIERARAESLATGELALDIAFDSVTGEGFSRYGATYQHTRHVRVSIVTELC